MKFVCPKCGKQFSVTNSELVALKGSIVCPQCLNVTTVPYKKPAAAAVRQRGTACPSCGAAVGASDTYCPSCGKPLTSTPPPRRTAATPPPRRRQQQSKPPVISFADSKYADGSTTSKASRPKRKPAKSAGSKSFSLADMSPWGCLWRSVAFTAALFLLYILFGKLTEM